MDRLESLLSGVPKDEEGFDDMDVFWKTTEKLQFPISEYLISKIFRSIKASSQSEAIPLPGEDSESEGEFNFETASDISVEIEEEVEEESELDDSEDDASTEPENEDNRPSILNSTASPTQAEITIPLSPASIESSVEEDTLKIPTPSSIHADESLGVFINSVASSGLGDLSFASKATKTSIRGRKSSLISTIAGTDSSQKSLQDKNMHSPGLEISRLTDNSSLMSPLLTVQHKTEVVEVQQQEGEEGGGQIEDDEADATMKQLETPLLSSIKKPGRPSTMSGRRVSFGAGMDLSPIVGEENGQDEEQGAGMTPGMDDVFSNEQSPELAEEMEEHEESNLSPSVHDPSSMQSSRRSSINSASTVAATTPETSVRTTPGTVPGTTPVSSAKHSTLRRTPEVSAVRTPQSRRASLVLPTPGSNDFIRGHRVSDASFHLDSEEEAEAAQPSDEDVDESTPSPTKGRKGKGTKQQLDDDDEEGVTEGEVSKSFIDESYLETISSANKKYAGKKLLEQTKALTKKQKMSKRNREVEQLLQDSMALDDSVESDEDESENEEGATRISKRATKGRRFNFWKNERPKYEDGTLVGLYEAEPTPKKPRRMANSKANKKRARPTKVEKKLYESDDEDAEWEGDNKKAKSLPPVKLPAKVRYIDGTKEKVLQTWDIYKEQPTEQRVVNLRSAMPPLRPLVPGDSKSGLAGHTFVIPEIKREISGWIAGYLDLPPQGVKDAELVGKYAQIFFVSSGQEKALEFGLADPSTEDWDDQLAQRVLLSPGDSFYVPPGNMYRLQNHSVALAAQLFFVVVQPIEEPNEEVGSSVSGATVVASH
eukprot:gene7461-8248_t